MVGRDRQRERERESGRVRLGDVVGFPPGGGMLLSLMRDPDQKGISHKDLPV